MGLSIGDWASSPSGGSLNGEPSIGLGGAESAKGLPDTGVDGSWVAWPPKTAPYGGGAVATDDGRGIGSAPAARAPAATAPAAVGGG